MRKVGLFFGSMFAIVAAFAFTSIASASAVDIPAYEKSSPILLISILPTAKRRARLGTGDVRQSGHEPSTSFWSGLRRDASSDRRFHPAKSKAWMCACHFQCPERSSNSRSRRTEKHSRHNGREGFSKRLRSPLKSPEATEQHDGESCKAHRRHQESTRCRAGWWPSAEHPDNTGQNGGAVQGDATTTNTSPATATNDGTGNPVGPVSDQTVEASEIEIDAIVAASVRPRKTLALISSQLLSKPMPSSTASLHATAFALRQRSKAFAVAVVGTMERVNIRSTCLSRSSSTRFWAILIWSLN
ncbi:hypothetical protein HGG75_10320 [Ochrobactrum pseudogrignonense]|nr:hypothetical protein [Brucella pseudogrignonensis]